MSFFPAIVVFVLITLAIPGTSMVYAAAPAGYSEYYVPGDEDSMMYILDTIGTGDQTIPNTMHAEIRVTAWSDTTTVYYDHWEDGYDFDPDNPSATADETVILTNRGDSSSFQGNNIPLPRTTAASCSPAGTCYYDGRDRFYVAGGVVTVSRASWTDMGGTLLAVAWEVYPVRPQLTTYILPFGEDLAAGLQNLQDFERVFALVQATSNSTTVTVDFNGDGTPDNIDPNRDGVCSDAVTSVTLNQGEVYVVDDLSNCSIYGSLNTGTIVKGTNTLQVQYVIGDQGSNYEIRGFSAFPRGLWDDEYYAPVDGPTIATDDPVDLYLHNPHATALTINYETAAASGNFNIPANSTVSFAAATGSYVPADSAVYLKGDDVFWGVSSIDIEATTHDWGYSLVPAFLLSDEYFMGWAPGYYPPGTAANYNDSGIYITAAQENQLVFIDTDNDGIADQTYTLDRLQTQYVYDPADGDMSDANIWATGPITIAYGQNPDTAPAAAPAIDVGYTTLPGGEFINKVLTVDKTADPVVVPTALGSTSTYTLEINTYDFNVDDISVSDILPADWEYVDDSTTITLADKSTISGDSADPVVTSSLDWPSSLLGSMGANQQIIITFDARTTKIFNPADITRNLVEVEGTSSVGAATQTFITSDFAFNTFGNLEISKTSDGVDPLSPGDTYTYTVTINNTSATETLTGIGVYDPIPIGISYVAASAQVTAPAYTVGDLFDSVAYNNNDGTLNWLTNWIEIADDGFAASGNVMITGGELTLDDNPDTGGFPALYREVDLTGATYAAWSFDWRTASGVTATDAVAVYAWSAALGWNQIELFTGITGASSGSRNYDITPYISANTRVAFRVEQNYSAVNQQFMVDNLFVTYDNTAVHDPPNFVAEDDNYQLAPGQAMTLTFDVLVDDPLPSGLDEITNTASITTNEFRLPINASVTNTVLNPSTLSGSVGDRVWLDTDGDGVLDVGESGLANVEVTLKDQFGTPIDTVYTDSNGYFLITGVTPGSGYYVQVTGGIPGGLQQSAPIGHSDDRTEPFDLNGGDEYLVADLGYAPAPGTATFGDLVWSDADSDGVRDSGEPGISGVTVEIYLDDGDFIFEPGTDDSLVSTTVTAADGTYLFAGVSASGTEDYYVYVDDTQAALSGYTNTTPVSLLQGDVDAGDTFSNFDFGFNNAADTNSIRDRVWFDTNGDGEDDTESGIAGVTVALLDSSRNVIATTTTDTSGYFEFNGVYDNNADYTIQITDTFGVLTDYYGTSGAAIAGEMDIDNLSSDIDNTVEPTEPSFAYNIKSAIGGTVFNDLDGNGVLGVGELGIAAIDVELYQDRGFIGVLGVGDILLYTDTTDASGSYIFSGLADDDYIISISPSPAGYNYTSELPGGDDDPAAGEQQIETLAGSSSNLAIDFGYQAIVSQSTSGTVWDDANTDGVIDGGEALLENVTVELYLDDGDSLFDSGLDTLTATVSSDANGDFSFNGLLQGNYWVVITDTGSVLAGYDPAFETTEGLTPPFNSREIVDLTGGDQNNINFGFIKPVPTLVVITDFRALVGTDGQVIIEWVTGSELDTIGFYLYRFDPGSKKYSKVRKGLLPAIMSAPQGSTYQLVDREAVPGRLYTYRLDEKERGGRTISYGPFTVLPGILDSAARTATNDEENDDFRDHSNGFRRTARKSLQKKKDLAKTKGGRQASANTMPQNDPGEALKITVTEDGVYYLPASEIASLFGENERTIKKLISRGQLSLHNQGRNISWLQDDGNQGIIFYGQAIDSLYTRENIYWLRVAKGMVMDKEKTGQRRSRNDDESLSFSDTLHIEEDHYPVAAYASDPESDYWYWDFVYGGAAGLDSKSFSFEAPEVADLEATAFLRIILAAATDTDAEIDHHVIISLNGTVMGAERWDGLQPHAAGFSFDQHLLHEGLNSLEITALLDSGVPYSVVGLDSFALTYERRYVAVDNKILFQGKKNHKINISGFSSKNILLFDITNPLEPVQYVKLQIDGRDGNYQVEFRPESPTDQYLAVTENTIPAPDAVSPAWSAGLQNPSNRADYLIITTAQLQTAVQALAEYRRAEGFRPMIVTINDIMDEFNHGISSPLAIRDFLQYATANWVIAPRFVVLAGDGSYDYRDLMGNGDNLVPTLMVPTPNGLSVSDTSLADLDGDGLPEMAVGRLPAQDPEDLMAMIDKIMAYEKNGGDWQNRMIYVADDPDGGGNFPEDSEFIAALAPISYDLQKIYLTEQSVDLARSNIINGINNGAAYLNYIGHGATDRLAQEGILRIADVPSLNSQSGHPVILAMTCVVGQFALPGWEALSESLMRKADGGAAAIWAPTGYSFNAEAMTLNEEFHWIVFRDGEKILGNAILQTLRNYRNRGGQPHVSAIYTLLGDPALHLRSKNYGQSRRKR